MIGTCLIAMGSTNVWVTQEISNINHFCSLVAELWCNNIHKHRLYFQYFANYYHVSHKLDNFFSNQMVSTFKDILIFKFSNRNFNFSIAWIFVTWEILATLPEHLAHISQLFHFWNSWNCGKNYGFSNEIRLPKLVMDPMWLNLLFFISLS